MSDNIQNAKIGKRYTVVIPLEIRKKIPLKEGESILLETDGKKIIMTPKDHNWAKQLAELMGNITFNRDTRQKAYDYALNLVREWET